MIWFVVVVCAVFSYRAVLCCTVGVGIIDDLLLCCCAAAVCEVGDGDLILGTR